MLFGRAALALIPRNYLRMMRVKEEEGGEGLPGKQDSISKSTERTLLSTSGMTRDLVGIDTCEAWPQCLRALLNQLFSH